MTGPHDIDTFITHFLYNPLKIISFHTHLLAEATPAITANQGINILAQRGSARYPRTSYRRYALVPIPRKLPWHGTQGICHLSALGLIPHWRTVAIWAYELQRAGLADC